MLVARAHFPPPSGAGTGGSLFAERRSARRADDDDAYCFVMTSVYPQVIPAIVSETVPVPPLPERVITTVDESVSPCTVSLHISVSVEPLQFEVHWTPASAVDEPASLG